MKIEEHNGAKFYHHYGKRDYKGVMTFNDKRIIMLGGLDITLVTDSWKYNKEIQLCILSPKEKDRKSVV
jgi:hypothetical protein